MILASTSKCPFCGKLLKVETVETLWGKVACRVEPCDCEKAVELRKMDEVFKRREAEAQAREKYERAGIAPLYMMARAAPYDWRKGFFIYGPVGAGKTYTASAISKQAIDGGAGHVHFTTESKLVDEICQTFDSKELKASQVYAKYGERCELLIIDDMGKRNPTPFVLSVIFNILDERYNNMLPTGITSQFSLEELGNRLSANGDPATAAAIVSRLSAMCPRIPINHPDRRMKRMQTKENIY